MKRWRKQHYQSRPHSTDRQWRDPASLVYQLQSIKNGLSSNQVGHANAMEGGAPPLLGKRWRQRFSLGLFSVLLLYSVILASLDAHLGSFRLLAFYVLSRFYISSFHSFITVPPRRYNTKPNPGDFYSLLKVLVYDGEYSRRLGWR